MDNEKTQATMNAEPVISRSDGRRYRGYRFKCQRKERGLLLKDVAKELKLSISKISLFERGRQDLSVKALERLEKLLKIPKADAQADAEARSREIALKTLQEDHKVLPGVSLPAFLRVATETPEARDARLIREHGSLENYLRHSAELQAKDEKISGLQMQLWDALGQIEALKAQVAQRDRREEKIKQTLNRAFYGEPD